MMRVLVVFGLAAWLASCALVYCPNCTITVDDADTITIQGNEALTQ